MLFLLLLTYSSKSWTYSWFHIKGTWSVHSFNADYLSIPEGTGSCGYLFHEIPGMRIVSDLSKPKKPVFFCIHPRNFHDLLITLFVFSLFGSDLTKIDTVTKLKKKLLALKQDEAVRYRQIFSNSFIKSFTILNIFWTYFEKKN